MTVPAERLRRAGFGTREALFLGFCATWVVIARAAFRLHLHVPGHAAFFSVFFLLLGRACVPRLGAATAVGGIAGLLIALLGMGKGGPLLLLKLLLPGVLIDVGAALRPRFATSVPTCALLGALAGSTRALLLAPLEFMLGVTPDLVLGHSALAAGGAALFGALGGAFVPTLYRRLAAHRMLPGAQAS